jgi:RNA polymerase sigma factor (sigma-70 family)
MVNGDEPRTPPPGTTAQVHTTLTAWLGPLERCALEVICGEGSPSAEEVHPELVQELLLWAWANLVELLKMAESEAKALLQRVWNSRAANLSRGRKRHERRLQRYAGQLVTDPQEAPPSDAELLNAECERVLGEALEGLPAPYHDVVVWHFLEKRTWEDIGQHLGCTERHARRLREQGLGILRSILEGRV